ncbi:MAG: LOG family protein [Acidimicrobiia bacterium]|nr:LOG family protein [Acidimicrobiia bacterium]MDH5292337.1 LOG family protein [Acidimicrobiia bacterium]
MTRIVSVFGSSTLDAAEPGYAEAVDLGAALARAGVWVATGGYGGTMEAVSKGAAGVGGHVIGVTAPAVFPGRAGANGFVTEEIRAATIAERIGALIDRADAYIALPGSLGTATELVVAWNERYLAPASGAPVKPLVAVGPGWRTFVDWMSMAFGAAPFEVVDDAATAAQQVLAALSLS